MIDYKHIISEEARASECPTGGAIVWMFAGFVTMGAVLLMICFC